MTFLFGSAAADRAFGMHLFGVCLVATLGCLMILKVREWLRRRKIREINRYFNALGGFVQKLSWDPMASPSAYRKLCPRCYRSIFDRHVAQVTRPQWNPNCKCEIGK